MGMERFRAPALPLAGMQYDATYMNQLLQVLRIYFAQLDSEAACKAFSYRAQHFYGGDLALDLAVLPTEAAVAGLAPGTVYRDSTAGNVLKVKV